MIAALPNGNGFEERLFEFRYTVSAVNEKGESAVLVSGTMNRIGESLRATVLGVAPGAERHFRVDVFDEAQIRTFTAEQVSDVGNGVPQVLLFDLERLRGNLELTAELPPEVEQFEVVVVVDGDSLRTQYSADETGLVRIDDIPTGADIGIQLRGLDAEEQVLIQHMATTDIRADLLARVSVTVSVGALHVVAYFPEYIEIVSVDRFSDEAGTFFRRSDIADLPDPGEPIDFDQERFRTFGFGPNGERIEFYNFDVRPNIPAPAYISVDRRGVSIPGQLPIFDLLPGEEGYNDIWQINLVNIPERDYKPNSLTSLEAVLGAGYEITPTAELMNCVMVPDGSRAGKRFDVVVPAGMQDGWYRGKVVKYLLFEYPGTAATIAFNGEKISTNQMFAFLENDRDLIDGFARGEGGDTHNVVSVLPGREEEADYSPLWLLRLLRLNAFDQVDNLASANLQTAENSHDQFPDLKLNAPIIGVE